MKPEVTFGDVELDDHHEAGIRDVLRRIVWNHPVAHIEVVRQLTGGVSGARVLQVRVSYGTSQYVRVVKTGPASETEREWQAYQNWIAPHANAYCAPLRERTPPRAADDPAGQWTALVYDHAGQFAGTPLDTVRTLEELAESGLDDIVSTVHEVLSRTVDVLHGRYEVVEAPISLRPLNIELGANLVLEVEQLDGDGVRYLRGSEAEFTLLHHEEVLRGTARGATDDLAVGTRLALADLELRRSDGALFAASDEIKVALCPAPGGELGAEKLADGASIAVWGRVVSTRGRTHRALVEQAMKGTAGGCAFGDSFAVLPGLLCDTRPGRVRSVSHGDLNLRNVLAVGNKRYLIDYARTDKLAQQSDFCWLEVGMMRDLLAHHDLGELLHLQRCLALATVLIELEHDVKTVAELVAELAGDQLRDAFRLLLVPRDRACSCYPRQAGPRLSEEYLRHLLLSAHRTFKWPEESQAPAKIRAAAAAAAVAAEWLDGGNSFRYWKRTTLSAALAALAPVIHLRDDRAVRLVADLVSAIEAFGQPDDDVEAAVTTVADRLVRCRCGAAARSLLVSRQPEHDGFVDLRTAPGGPAVVATLSRAKDVTLVGEADSGKSTVARELAYQLAMNVVTPTKPARIPLLVLPVKAASPMADLLVGWGLETVATESFTLGAVHVIVDCEGTRADSTVVRVFVRMLRAQYPRTPIVVCERHADPEAARVEVLQPLSYTEMVAWLRHGSGDRTDAEHLLRLLLDDPGWSWVNLRRPRWLSLVAGYVRGHGLPERLPTPHEVIARMSDRVDMARDAHLHRSYLRARELARGDPSQMLGDLRTSHWDTYRILVTLPEVDDEIVRQLGRAVGESEPTLAAELFRAADLDTPEFATRMQEVLRNRDAGPLRWRTAARALYVLDGRRGADGLARATVDPSVPRDAAREALVWLGQLYDATLSRPRRHTVAAVLAKVLRQVLDTPELASLRETALDLVTRTALPGLDLFTAQLVDEAQPWPVLHGAVSALRAGGVALPKRLVDTYTSASRARLTVLDRTLPSLTIRSEVDTVHEERNRLVAELAPTESLPWLLRRRFAFGASRRVVKVVDGHLAGSAPIDRLLEDVEQDVDVTAYAAAHRLLRDASDTAGRALTVLDPDASAARLLMSASAVPYAGRTKIGLVADVFDCLLAAVEVDRMEGMAALITAIHRVDHSLGMRLARSATAVLAERDVRARHCWPWAVAMSRVQGMSRDLDGMLCAGGEPALAAVTALASSDFHRSARPRTLRRLSDPARRQLLSMARTVEWALAAGAATVIEALPDLPGLIEESDRVVSRVSARYGLIEQAEAADVLAVLGYLARMAHEADAMPGEVVAAHRLLTEFEVGGRHASVAAGRLIGLAYLGDWTPILRADLSTPRKADAAHHAIERWLPGPATPPGYETPLAVVWWITDRLRREPVPTDQRWALELLKHRAKRALLH